jgi:HD-GYP domain-containing protein (c-di-GMP phosphodiesterase class II)
MATAQTDVHLLHPAGSPCTAGDAAAATSVRLAQWQLLTEHLSGVLYAPLTCGDVAAQIGQCAGMLRRLVHEDADLAIFLVVNDHPGKLARYSAAHALHTATLVSLIARRKDWSPATELCGIQAALTMNIAMSQMQDELAQQSAPLTPEQRQIVQQHPLAGRRLLMQLGVTDADWLDAVTQHHEQADGRGYPYGARHVCQLADAIHTADVFAAKLSPRIGRSGMPSPRAAAEIFKHSSASYFGATVIRELGLYPPGCLVQLSSGETAMVLRRTGDPLCPEVALLTTDEGQMLTTPHRCLTGAAHQRTVKCAAANPALVARFAAESLYG